MSRRLVVLFFLPLVWSCSRHPVSAPPEPGAPAQAPPAAGDLVRVEPDTIPELADDLSPQSLVSAIDRDIEFLARLPGDRMVRLADTACPIARIQLALQELRDLVDHRRPLDEYARSHFKIYRSTARPEGALFTGYYEPVIEGRRERREPFVYPLYRRPAELADLEPYFTRREIDGDHALEGRGLELVWLADPVARYFLHVQGSGIVHLADGSSVRVGFAASNGRRYTSVGRLLQAEGALEREVASAPAIQRYLYAHPERLAEILFANERYIFFREVEDGPIGSLGVKLTAGRSIATDPSLYPQGALAYIRTETPVVDERSGLSDPRKIHRFVLNQDSGGAITGPGRADLFFGTGERAGMEAGHMSAAGELYFLMPEC